MPKKHTYEFVKEQFKEKGYILLSKEYVDCNKPLRFICPAGHVHKISFTCFYIKNQRCKRCFDDKQRFSIDYIRENIENEGYKLLTKRYINSIQKLSIICPNNHKTDIAWGSWQAGRRCRYCARNVRFTIEFVKTQFRKENYKLLTKVYKNQKQKLDYVCPFGHKHNITFTDWYNGNYRCPTCYFIKNSGSGNYAWKGGISFEPYCEIWKDKEYKNDIKERDSNSCLNPCCSYKRPRDLVIHHIDYNKKNCRPDNLITICRGCNIKANEDRVWHTAWYQAIMYKRYNYIY